MLAAWQPPCLRQEQGRRDRRLVMPAPAEQLGQLLAFASLNCRQSRASNFPTRFLNLIEDTLEEVYSLLANFGRQFPDD